MKDGVDWKTKPEDPVEPKGKAKAKAAKAADPTPLAQRDPNVLATDAGVGV